MARRYSSPPEVHARSAKGAAKSARWWLKEVRTNLRNGNCKGALEALTTANRMSAIATTERRGAGTTRAQYQTDTLRSALVNFARTCVRKG